MKHVAIKNCSIYGVCKGLSLFRIFARGRQPFFTSTVHKPNMTWDEATEMVNHLNGL